VGSEMCIRVSSSAAVDAALRAATGRELTRVPVKPDDICLVPDTDGV
jgi:CO/xanthine dehydrogenase Mo-binding subunit